MNSIKTRMIQAMDEVLREQPELPEQDTVILTADNFTIMSWGEGHVRVEPVLNEERVEMHPYSELTIHTFVGRKIFEKLGVSGVGAQELVWRESEDDDDFTFNDIIHTFREQMALQDYNRVEVSLSEEHRKQIRRVFPGHTFEVCWPRWQKKAAQFPQPYDFYYTVDAENHFLTTLFINQGNDGFQWEATFNREAACLLYIREVMGRRLGVCHTRINGDILTREGYWDFDTEPKLKLSK